MFYHLRCANNSLYSVNTLNHILVSSGFYCLINKDQSLTLFKWLQDVLCLPDFKSLMGINNFRLFKV